MQSALGTVLAILTAIVLTPLALANGIDPLINPDAVRHQIDRSAMEIQIQACSRDMKYPIYPIRVQAGGSCVYYLTTERVKRYKEVDVDEPRCGIGDADRAELNTPGCAYADGVCMANGSSFRHRYASAGEQEHRM